MDLLQLPLSRGGGAACATGGPSRNAFPLVAVRSCRELERPWLSSPRAAALTGIAHSAGLARWDRAPRVRCGGSRTARGRRCSARMGLAREELGCLCRREPSFLRSSLGAGGSPEPSSPGRARSTWGCARGWAGHAAAQQLRGRGCRRPWRSAGRSKAPVGENSSTPLYSAAAGRLFRPRLASPLLSAFRWPRERPAEEAAACVPSAQALESPNPHQTARSVTLSLAFSGAPCPGELR